VPGDRGRVLGGCWNAFILDSGMILGWRPVNSQRIVP
jgi:hypothetical protein